MKTFSKVAALFAIVLASAGARALETPDWQSAGKSWWAHVQYLADDRLEGRDTGSPGFQVAANYVVGQFKEAGLAPGGTDGYFQPIQFNVVQLDASRSSWELEESGRRTEIAIGSDAYVALHSALNEAIDARSVFVGYGFSVPERGYNELAGLDLRGKIAVFLEGSPPTIFGPIRQYHQSPSVRWEALREAGAIGYVAIPNPSSSFPRDRVFRRRSSRPVWLLADSAAAGLPGLEFSATINPSVADELLANSGHTFAELQALANSGNDLPKFPLAVEFHVRLAVTKIRQVTSTNLIGVLTGSDRRLKKEYVVLTAHLDHLGVGTPVNGDAIYNGAMDNASGVASLIEIAKSLGAEAHRPKRSIIFLSTTGEEKGVFGSQFFVSHPTVPLDRIVAEINMDMFLPLFPLKYLEVQGLAQSTLGDDIRAVAQLNDVEVQFDKQPSEGRFARGDHANFIKAGIPGVGFKFGWIPGSPEETTFNDWIRTRYHKPSDDLNQPVDLVAAARFTNIVGEVALRIANSPTRPSWHPESFMSQVAHKED